MSYTTYTNPNTPTIENPVNLDKQIQEIQLAIGLIPWIEKSFGRAWTGRRQENGKTYLYPEVYAGKGEYLNVLLNDSWQSQSFIRVQSDRQRVKNYEINSNNLYSCTLDAIICFNLQKINPSRGYRFNEELKKDATDVIKTLSQLKIQSIYESPEDVYNGYSLDHSDWQTFKHPFGGFRIECVLEFAEDC